MLETLNKFAEQYGFFVVGGAIGAIIHRLRNKMSIKRFLASIAISMFVSLCVGIIAKDYFELKQSIIYVLCGISGVFSNTILDEIEELLKYCSDAFKIKFGIFGDKQKNKTEELPHIPENPEQTLKDLNNNIDNTYTPKL